MLVYYCDDVKAKDIEKYWGDRFPMMFVEECAELQLAIAKHERYSNEETLKNLKEEMRDVIMCISAYSTRLNIDPMEINGLIKEKLDKTYDEH